MGSTPRITRTQVLRWQPEDPKRNPWLRERGTGLCLRVRLARDGSIRREFYLSYEWQRRTRYKSLGPIEMHTLDEARQECIELRKRIRAAAREGKGNPLDEAADARQTLKAFAEQYQKLTKKSAAVKKKDARRWEAKILPFRPTPRGARMGEMWVHAVTPLHLEALKTEMEKTPTAFNHCLRLLSNAFNKARDWDVIPRSAYAEGWSNPASRVAEYPENRRTRTYKPGEIAAFLNAFEILLAEAQERMTDPVQHYHATMRYRSLLGLRILAFTGARPDELLRLERKWVLWSRSCIDLPKQKGDRRTIKGRIIAVGPERLKDLKALDDVADGSPWLFPGRGPSGHLATGAFTRSWKLLKKTADSLAGTCLADDKTADPYTWRHTLVSAHSDPAVGVDIATMSDFIGHARKGTTEIYRHTMVPRLVDTAVKLEQWLLSHGAADDRS